MNFFFFLGCDVTGCLSSALTSYIDGLQTEVQAKINPFSLRLLFCQSSNRNKTRKTLSMGQIGGKFYFCTSDQVFASIESFLVNNVPFIKMRHKL